MKSDEIRYPMPGFTLLEVLLAMALLSIIMVLLFASLAASAKSWHLGENKIAQVNEKALTYGFFKRYLQAARPVFANDSTDIAFDGKEQSLEFVANAPLSSGFKGLQVFSVAYQSSEEGGKLSVALKPYTLLEEETGEVEEQILLERIESFRIDYFDPGEGAWLEQWSEKEELPALVKISIALTDHSDWPPIIFAMKLAGKPGQTTLPALGL